MLHADAAFAAIAAGGAVDRPPTVTIGQEQMQPWARGIVWDCLAPSACVPVQRSTRFTIFPGKRQLDRAALRRVATAPPAPSARPSRMHSLRAAPPPTASAASRPGRSTSHSCSSMYLDDVYDGIIVPWMLHARIGHCLRAVRLHLHRHTVLLILSRPQSAAAFPPVTHGPPQRAPAVDQVPREAQPHRVFSCTGTMPTSSPGEAV